MAATLRQRYGPAALVTGASSGIGAQFARQLAAQGFDLLLAARREAQLQALATTLAREHGVRVDVQACDLGAPDEVAALIARARGLDLGLLVSNAGYGVPKGEFLGADLAAVQAMVQTNSLAPAQLIHALLPAMVARGRGGLICTGSIEGEAVFPYSASYAASKAFLHSLVLGIAGELRGSGVDVLLLAPGATDTEAPLRQGIAREALSGVMDPADVVAQALVQLGRRAQLIPGAQNRLLVGLLRLLPRRLEMALTAYGLQRAMAQSRGA